MSIQEGEQYMIDIRGNPVERGTHEAILAAEEKEDAGFPQIDREELVKQVKGWREEYRSGYSKQRIPLIT